MWARPIVGFASAMCLLVAAPAPAQTPTQYEAVKVQLPLPSLGERGVAMHGDLMVATGRHDAGGGAIDGDVHVFRRSGGTWNEEAVLSEPDGGGTFGYSIGVSGNVIVVGGYGISTPTGFGAAYVYRFDGSSWNQDAKLTGAGQNFGIGVAVDVDRIVVGAYTETSGRGAVYVYHYNGAEWIQEARLTASDAQANDQLGRIVNVSGDVIVASAWQAAPAGAESGAAYVFRRNSYSGTWSQDAKLVSPTAAAGDRFSSGVDVEGDRIVVGARFTDANSIDGGAAYVFQYNGAAWYFAATLLPDGAGPKSFGHVVSLDRNVAAISSPYGGPTNKGTTEVFAFDGTQWNRQIKLMASDGVSGDLFGTGVAAEGGWIGVGSQPASGRSIYMYLLPDADADGIDDLHEAYYGTDALNADTDGDGLPDGVELNHYGTSPTDADTDHDGLTDGQEIAAQQFGCPDPRVADTDGDGLGDGLEVQYGLSPCSNADTDGDGLMDAQELLIYGTDPLNADTDGDGLFDGTEVDMAQGGSCPSPTLADSDGDGLSDGAEVDLGTSPCSADTDGDTITDNVDPLPTVPGVTTGYIEDALRSLCRFVDGLPLDHFDAPNDNARKGRRGALCNKLNAAAKSVGSGQRQAATDEINSLLPKLDDEASPPDWMTHVNAVLGQPTAKAYVRDTLTLLRYLMSLAN